MIRSKSQSMVNLFLTIAGALLLLEGTLALVRHEPPLHFWGRAPKGQAWEIVLLGTFCFFVGFSGFVKKKRRGQIRSL
jgi:hypothetical protein